MESATQVQILDETVNVSLLANTFKKSNYSSTVPATACQYSRLHSLAMFRPGEMFFHLVAQSAGAVEYTDCFSAEG